MKPILFNTDMVRAILDGRKTVTRRVVKRNKQTPAYYGRENFNGLLSELNGEKSHLWAGFYKESDIFFVDGKKHIDAIYFKAPFQPGDILYVRETFCKYSGEYIFKASVKQPELLAGMWHPNIHMPKEAARIFLRATNVRVERLRDITVDGALREGTPDVEPPPICRKEISYPESFPKGFDGWDEARREDWIQSTARARYIGWCDYADRMLRKFSAIWDSTIKQENRALYGWKANPWVWVIEFERISKKEARCD